MMVLIRRFLFIGFCFFPLLPSFSQNSLLPPPALSAISSYSLSEGLPEACLEKIFIDGKGRLWINPCSYAATDRSINFFQYDGRKAYFYPLQPDWAEKESDSPLWFVEGETTRGFLFGADRGRSAVFSWNPDTKEQYFWQFERGKKILSLTPESQGSLLALILDRETYQAYRLTESKSQKIGEIMLKNWEEERSYRFPHSFVVGNGQAWFLHHREGLVSLDLAQGNMQFWSWENIGLPLQKHPDDYHEGLTWKIASRSENTLFLYLGRMNGFFTLDLSTFELEPKADVNQRIFSQQERIGFRLYFSQDKKNNLLIVSRYEALNEGFMEAKLFQALLLDPTGRLHNYTKLIEELSVKGRQEGLPAWMGGSFSRDFQRQIGWASYSGAILADLQTELQIEAFPMPHGARAMLPLDSLHLLVNTDGPDFLLNLRDGAYDFFKGGNLHVNIQSPFVLDKDHILWAARQEDSLLRYDLNLEQADHFSLGLDFDKFTFLNPDEIALISRDGRLFIYNLKEQLKRPFLHQGVPFSIAGRANDLHLTADNILWIATQNGLWRIRLERKEVSHFDRSNGLPGDNIMCMLPAKDGRLWLGTVQAGILVFDPKTLEVKQIARVNGLAHNTVAGMLADAQNNVWAATFNGISAISPQAEVLFNITQSNGLTHNEFNRTSYVKLPDGRLAFGGVEGVNILNPAQILEARLQKEPLYIFLTQMEYYDKKKKKNQVFKGSLKQEAPIPIPATNRYLSLDLALSEYVNLLKHTYSYRLLPLGASDQSVAAIPWISLGPISELTLNNLPVGDYIVQIRGIDQNSRQVESPLEIRIQVEEFFYRTWPFYMFCALPFLFGGWIWIRRILTERKRLQAEVDKRTEQIRQDKEIITQQAQELQRLDEAKSRFFANISHELRTPLTIILGMIDQIEKQPQRWLRNGAKMIRNNGANLLDLVNQILELQKLESGSLSINMELGDIIPFLKMIFDQFQAFAVSKEQQMEFMSELESQYMDYDPEKMLRILSNLLSNAVKYTPEKGKITFRISSETNADVQAGRFLVMTVRDTGPGIPEDQLPYIFDRFYQADGNHQGRGSGTGIGLSLTQELVKLLNGKIEASSQEGKGTSFRVFLPITQKANPGRTDAPANIQSFLFGKQDPVKKERRAAANLPIALIVEDNSDITEYLQICLEGSYRTISAVNGQEGIDLALEQIPDLIVSDVMTPKKNGFELCEILKQDVRTSHIPIILLTAKSDIESRIAGLKKGADDYLAKPFNEEELLVRMHNLLAIRRKLQERYQNIYERPLPKVKTAPPSIEDAFILKIKEILEDRMTDLQFNLDDLCDELHLSRSNLYRKIKALTGRSPAVYIRSLRLQKAREILLSSSLSVKKVAYEVGFSDPSYFSKSYTDEFGESPSASGTK